MLKKLILLSLFFLLLVPSPALAAPPPDFSPEEIIVKFKPDISEKEIEQTGKNLGAGSSEKHLLPQTFIFKVPDKQIDKFVSLFSKNPQVEYAEPNYIAYALGILTPNDPYFNNQWGMTKVLGPEAWDIFSGSVNVKIAILDTGIDKNHEDLMGKIDARKNFTRSKTDDDLYGHGTHVAGIAAANTNNGLGVAGLGFNSHLLSVKVLDDTGSGSYSGIANGIKWAADNGAKVINLSLGGSSSSKTLEQAINYAWNKGVVLSCAAGNSNDNSPTYPAYYKNCISVAATDEKDKRAVFSSFGSWVDVAAPGVNIFSTFPNHPYKIGKSLNYDYGSGTSMATSYVAGLAGFLFGTDPTLTAAKVRGLIEDNSDNISGTGTYWQKGRINAYKAIIAVPNIVLPVITEVSVNPSPTPTPIPVQVSASISTPVMSLAPENNLNTSSAAITIENPVPKPWWCSIFSPLCP